MSRRFTRLTRPSIRGLKPGEKITEAGITADGLVDGDVRYSVNVMVDGQRIHRVIGRESEGVTRTQAEEFIARVRAEAKEQRLGLPKGRKIHLTFAKAAEFYMCRMRETGGKNFGEKERHLRLHLVPEFGTIPVDKISTFALERYRRRVKSRGLQVGTVNRHLATYRHLARKLFEWGKVMTPMAMVKLERENNRREVVLSQDEKSDLLDAALNDSNLRIWLFMMMGMHTGLRHSEILAGRFEHLDTKRRRLRARVKGDRWREQPLTRAIADVLSREREMADDENGWIFPNCASKSGHVDSMKKAFRRCVERAGLDPRKVIPHTLRHTAITEMAETGAEARTIQAFSGHLSKEMVWRYTHVRDQRIDEALDRFEAEGTKVEQIADRKKPRS